MSKVIRNKLGPIPDDHFENEPGRVVKNKTPLTAEQVEWIERVKNSGVTLKAIQILNKQTFALEAIAGFASLTNTTPEAKLALIEITAAETLKELAPEIESVKCEAMDGSEGDFPGPIEQIAKDKYRPGDEIAGY